MRIDGYTKALLTIIALALVVIAVRPLLSPTPSYAAKVILYKVYGQPGFDTNSMEFELNNLGRQGWDFAGVAGNRIIMKQ
jgi:hypothetical protein